MKKIVITGGLGYIGTELCKIYSGEARFKNVIVIDNRFISERVKQLNDWGITYVNGSILDEKLMKHILHDCDVIHHLAGITDVAYVKTESNSEQDNKIIETSIIGTSNVLKYSPSHCRIIFPSTHVVYEGFQETKHNIEEEEPTCPVLTYSTSKLKNEEDIKSSGKDYIILRLGSVYGYSTDTMRINIMPNLFSKMASQNQDIKLYSGGRQYKSLVNLIDVARCFKFMEEYNVKNETYHLVNERCTVKQVAEICKKVNPKVKLVETKDEVPNLGYTLSNKKILSTGFNFLYNLEDSVEEMIRNWSFRNKNLNIEYIIRGEKEFIDDRGKISNYELTEPINLIGYIESKKGTVRANHYHPIQEQKCLLVKGKYISVIKDLSIPNSPIETRIINEGDIAIIKPYVAHTMVFIEDSIFLNLVRGEREHENYGITHTIPYILVDENFKNNLIKNYSQNCRVCENEKLSDVISLGLSPLANNLIDSSEKEYDKYPLEMKYCNKCHNCQLSYNVESEKMFDNYLYVSSTTSSFKKHFEDSCKIYITKYNLNENSFVLDIGSNDGISLKVFKEMGINVIGVEPAKNVAKIANNNGINTINKYFTEKTSKEILDKYGKFDLITASNVFAHTNKISEMTNGVYSLLKDNGKFIIEVQYLLNTLKDVTFDNIYHEHVNYWSLTSMIVFFEKHKLYVEDCEIINTHGGSIRVFISKIKSKKTKFLEEQLRKEKDYSLFNYDSYLKFGEEIIQRKNNLITNLKKIKETYKKIYGYGAPAKATTSLNYYGITNNEIEAIIEDNDLKIGKLIPGTGIPIHSKKYFEENIPDCVLVLAWNFFDYILQQNDNHIKNGVRFINIKDLEKKDFQV
jgi:nucleoside-diphosphate-sugar epimerase/2-polyprenyl-3-methyl-5-hydroxy-6-metoxy-1,4-benzoquinol methylase/dTDP-4-dehydrorhamnose 3,5-epimerase-like enzyme